MCEKRGKVLLFDSKKCFLNPDLCLGLSALLKEQDYDFEIIESQNRGKELIKEGIVFLVIGFTDEIEFLKLVKRIRPDIEIIVLIDSNKKLESYRDTYSAIGCFVDLTIDNNKMYGKVQDKLLRYERLVHKKTGNGMGDNIFITGGTGFLGDEIIRRYLTDTDCHLWVLSRAKDNASAQDRILKRVEPDFHSRVTVLEGDLGSVNSNGNFLLGLDDKTKPENYKKFIEMTEACNEVVHNGAFLSFEQGEVVRQKLFDTNVMGTQRVLNVINKFKRALESFNYVSTVFVHGIKAAPQIFYEDNSSPNRWLNPYEESKWRAESIVRNSGLPFRIFRPSIIAKEPESETLSSETMYGIARVIWASYQKYKKKNISERPAVNIECDPDSSHNIILRKDLVDIMIRVRASGKGLTFCYNVTNPHNIPAAYFFNAVSRVLGVDFNFIDHLPTVRNLNTIETMFKKLVIPRYEGYLFKPLPKYDMSNVRKILGDDYVDNKITRNDQALMDVLIQDYYSRLSTLSNQQNTDIV